MNPTLARIPVVCVAGLALLATACTSEEVGTPTAGAGASTSNSSRTSNSGTAERGSALADVRPCDLLTGNEVTSLGLTNPGESDNIGGTDSCQWSVSGNGGLIVGVRPEAGLDDISYDRDKAISATVGKYEAVKVEAPRGSRSSCEVLIPVSDSASVQVVGNLKSTSTDTAAACERTTKAAELIAPKLP
ncbi:DUF3558 domain-containing protein [Saccharothrix coeruleofusca]|uniref:DUF3558 domain-containing protein n=1 Tax=Saccharothrix coeruleofusca TaxID=33919 RepID=A0A918AR56_9PSEU|nr:DUF3558 domain-containing protein [Saccharothrix coeruleofusca]MBP2334621.1 hypothetical protein [Saccharothrix coeruleofusca]GGP73149.1 hypothetical protein GCM10010185_53280 [Saccharothrix coeruleofusca]